MILSRDAGAQALGHGMDVLLLDEGFAELAAEIGINGVGEAVTENAEDDVDFFSTTSPSLLEKAAKTWMTRRRLVLRRGGFADEAAPEAIEEATKDSRAVEVTLLEQGRRGGGGAIICRAKAFSTAHVGVSTAEPCGGRRAG